MTDLVALMKSYQAFHRKKFTKLTHFIGVPCIVFSLLVVLSKFSFHFLNLQISLMWPAVMALLLYYLYLDWYVVVVVAGFLIPLAISANIIAHYPFSYLIALIFFSGGWLLQFIGHYVEGKQPAFFANLLQLFTAPAFLAMELIMWFRKNKNNN